MLNKKFVTHPIHGECIYIDNGVIEIGVPLTFGLRVTHLSFLGEDNVFFAQPKEMQLFTNKEGWRLRGGHRLWLAPESKECYAPDNQPIEYKIDKDKAIFIQKIDQSLQCVKIFEISLKGNCVNVTHKITNTSDKSRKVSLWSLSVMKSGGVATIPLMERQGGYDPLTVISAWDYTNLGDERLKFDKSEIKIYQKKSDRKLKIGVGHPLGPITYQNGDTIFKKYIPYYKGRKYPDGGVSFEIFVSDYMTELEGLSPLKTILPNKSATYKEKWELCRKDV